MILIQIDLFGHRQCCTLIMEVIQSLLDFCNMLELYFLTFIQTVKCSQFYCCESAMDTSDHFIITHISFREQISNGEERTELCDNTQNIGCGTEASSCYS